MNNLIKKYVSKKYQNAVMDFFHDEDGYWLWLTKEYYEPIMFSHVIHEDTIADVLEKLRAIKIVDDDARRYGA